MRVFGVSVVRNEACIIRLTLLHHLSLGFDGLLVVDNGSSDGTDQELARFRHDKRVRWTRDDSPFDQSKITSELAREAFRLGADWVIPFDADEFWYARSYDFRRLLSETQAVALRVKVVNFIQSYRQRISTPSALLTMTYRTREPAGPPERCQELVESKQMAFVEMMYPPKFLCRVSPDVVFSTGNHEVLGVEGRCEERMDLAILHAPLRSQSTLERKAEDGIRREEAGESPGSSWHIRRWSRLQTEGALEGEWAANSHKDGFLDVYGSRRPVVLDLTLRDLVAPIIGSLGRTRSKHRVKYREAIYGDNLS